jgi:hypothetical protein
MNQKLHLKTHLPLKTSSKIDRHQMAEKNSVTIWQFSNDGWKCQQIHHGQPKFIIVAW